MGRAERAADGDAIPVHIDPEKHGAANKKGETRCGEKDKDHGSPVPWRL
jgi:hypothetical protein